MSRNLNMLAAAVAIAAGIVLLLLPGQASSTAFPAVSEAASGGVVVVQVADRPEMRSHQPYSGLQFGFRPEPPSIRGVTRMRPRVIAPTPRQPLIEYGTQDPDSARWYKYCAIHPRGIEPRADAFATDATSARSCR
jgi:hypothetical protein